MHRTKRKKKEKMKKGRETIQPSLYFFSFFVPSRFLRYLRLYTTLLCQINSPLGREAIVLVIVPTDNCEGITVVNDCLLREISENGNWCAPCDVMIAGCPVQTNNCNNGRLFCAAPGNYRRHSKIRNFRQSAPVRKRGEFFIPD